MKKKKENENKSHDITILHSTQPCTKKVPFLVALIMWGSMNICMLEQQGYLNITSPSGYSLLVTVFTY